MHIGIKSVGRDGTEYRSDLEREFCDNFLFDKYHYEYENSYNDGTKRTCDFHIPIFNLWLEVVPYEADLFQIGSSFVVPEKIFLNASFNNKEVVKKNGAHWDKEVGRWYILKFLYDKFNNTENLRRFLPKYSDDMVFINQNKPEFKNFKDYYDNIQNKKTLIESRGGLFCTVHNSDLSCDSLLHILQSKGFDGWKFIRIAEQVKFDKIDKFVTAEINRRKEKEEKSKISNKPTEKKFNKPKNKKKKTSDNWMKRMNDSERLDRLKKFKESQKVKNENFVAGPRK